MLYFSTYSHFPVPEFVVTHCRKRVFAVQGSKLHRRRYKLFFFIRLSKFATYMVWNRCEKKGRRKSYLPFRPNVLGFYDLMPGLKDSVSGHQIDSNWIQRGPKWGEMKQQLSWFPLKYVDVVYRCIGCIEHVVFKLMLIYLSSTTINSHFGWLKFGFCWFNSLLVGSWTPTNSICNIM